MSSTSLDCYVLIPFVYLTTRAYNFIYVPGYRDCLDFTVLSLRVLLYLETSGSLILNTRVKTSIVLLNNVVPIYFIRLDSMDPPPVRFPSDSSVSIDRDCTFDYVVTDFL